MTVTEQVEKIYVDMYVGRGKDNPSIVTRLAVVESNLASISRNLSKIVWLLVSTMIIIIGDIVIRGIK